MANGAPMSKKSFKAYFRDYPDVLDIEQMCEILNISTKTGYRLLNENKVQAFKIGRAFRIPKTAIIGQDKLKRDASFRTLPMVEPIRDLLFCEIKRRYGINSFLQEDYICVDEKEMILKPNYISEAFPKLLKKYNLRHIRFHDLRHSCANLLITSRVPLIEVQQWMGHSNISTTADMYGHLTFENKLNSAETIKKN